MDCNLIRTAISARLDGEHPGLEPDDVDAHVARCPACRAFAEGAAGLHRAARLGSAPPVPDLTPAILAFIERAEAVDPTGARERVLRVVLALIAVVQLAVAVPPLVLGDDAGLPMHSARHLGSFGVALAVGFLFAAWRPERCAGLVPVAAALVACLVGTSVLDVSSGHAAALGEAHHAAEVAGLLVIWLLVRPPHRRPSRLAA
jgi:predicted anti-sigma-YlaC factor YlaD